MILVSTDFFKELGLFLSDQFSSTLKIQEVGLVNINSLEQPYNAVLEAIPDYSHFGITNCTTQGLVIHADPKLVTFLTKRSLGNNHNSATSTFNHFTFSELFLFKTLVEWISAFFAQKKYPLHVHRLEQFSRSIHLFFHDEPVVCITLTFKFSADFQSPIQFIFPLKLVEAELNID
jgi:hypothetical protein